ncbi:Hypothetical protein, putative [Bodo saltans]|uniref:Uncharacterized protein n=1 Tax=Bodo saltans TaxID=75058 RepID=A0A0S4JGJ9_BODSA|nr:Hypothetical protein, putative [Bodo saltans]|eukprot:CUG87531.1 Hypothetical protein, putative [Bodo saltans]
MKASQVILQSATKSLLSMIIVSPAATNNSSSVVRSAEDNHSDGYYCSTRENQRLSIVDAMMLGHNATKASRRQANVGNECLSTHHLPSNLSSLALIATSLNDQSAKATSATPRHPLSILAEHYSKYGCSSTVADRLTDATMIPLLFRGALSFLDECKQQEKNRSDDASNNNVRYQRRYPLTELMSILDALYKALSLDDKSNSCMSTLSSQQQQQRYVWTRTELGQLVEMVGLFKLASTLTLLRYCDPEGSSSKRESMMMIGVVTSRLQWLRNWCQYLVNELVSLPARDHDARAGDDHLHNGKELLKHYEELLAQVSKSSTNTPSQVSCGSPATSAWVAISEAMMTACANGRVAIAPQPTPLSSSASRIGARGDVATTRNLLRAPVIPVMALTKLLSSFGVTGSTATPTSHNHSISSNKNGNDGPCSSSTLSTFSPAYVWRAMTPRSSRNSRSSTSDNSMAIAAEQRCAVVAQLLVFLHQRQWFRVAASPGIGAASSYGNTPLHPLLTPEDVCVSVGALHWALHSRPPPSSDSGGSWWPLAGRNADTTNELHDTLLYCVLEACRAVFVTSPPTHSQNHHHRSSYQSNLPALVAGHLLALEHTLILAEECAASVVLLSTAFRKKETFQEDLASPLRRVLSLFEDVFRWASYQRSNFNAGIAALTNCEIAASRVPHAVAASNGPLLATGGLVDGLRRNPRTELMRHLEFDYASSSSPSTKVSQLLQLLSVDDTLGLLHDVETATSHNIQNRMRRLVPSPTESTKGGDKEIGCWEVFWESLLRDVILKKWSSDIARRQPSTFSGRSHSQRVQQRQQFVDSVSRVIHKAVELSHRCSPNILDKYRVPVKELLVEIENSSFTQRSSGGDVAVGPAMNKHHGISQRSSTTSISLLLEDDWRKALQAVHYLPTQRDQRKAALHVLRLTVSLGGDEAITALVSATVPQHPAQQEVMATSLQTERDEQQSRPAGDSSLSQGDSTEVGMSTINLPQLVTYAAEYCRAQNTPEAMARLGSIVERIAGASLASPQFWSVGLLCCNLAYRSAGNAHMIKYGTKALQTYMKSLEDVDRERVLLARVFAAVSYAGKRRGQWESVISAFYSQFNNHDTDVSNDVTTKGFTTSPPFSSPAAFAKEILSRAIVSQHEAPPRHISGISTWTGAYHLLTAVMYSAQQLTHDDEGAACPKKERLVGEEERNNNTTPEQLPLLQRMVDWTVQALPAVLFSIAVEGHDKHTRDHRSFNSMVGETAPPSSLSTPTKTHDTQQLSLTTRGEHKYQKNLSETVSLLLSSRKQRRELTQSHGIAVMSAFAAQSSHRDDEQGYDLHWSYHHPTMSSLVPHTTTATTTLFRNTNVGQRRANVVSPREVQALSFLAECRIHGAWEAAMGALLTRLQSKHDYNHHLHNNNHRRLSSSSSSPPPSPMPTASTSSQPITLAWSMVHVPLAICNDANQWNTAIAAYFSIKRRMKNVNILQQSTFEGLLACRATGRWRDAIRMVSAIAPTTTPTTEHPELPRGSAQGKQQQVIRVTPRNASLLLDTLITFGATAVSAVVAQHLKHIREPHVVDEIMTTLVANRQWNDAVNYFYETVQHGVRVRDRAITHALTACNAVTSSPSPREWSVTSSSSFSRRTDTSHHRIVYNNTQQRHPSSFDVIEDPRATTTTTTSSASERQRASVVASIAGALEDLCVMTGAVLQHVLLVVHKQQQYPAPPSAFRHVDEISGLSTVEDFSGGCARSTTHAQNVGQLATSYLDKL